MTPNRPRVANDTPYRRIDEMRMSAAEREVAKAQLWAGEQIAEGLCELAAALRAGAAYVARHLRATSPQH